MQKTHIVLFKPPRDVQQISVLGKLLGLGNTLQKWYAGATSVPYGHLMIDLSTKANNLLHCSTAVTSFPTKFYLPSSRSRVTQKKIKNLDYFTLKLFLTSSTQFQRIFLKFCSKDFRFFCECCIKILPGNLKDIEKTKLHGLKNIIRKLVSKNTSSKARRFLLASKKRIYLLNFVGNAVLRKFSQSIENGKQ